MYAGFFKIHCGVSLTETFFFKRFERSLSRGADSTFNCSALSASIPGGERCNRWPTTCVSALAVLFRLGTIRRRLRRRRALCAGGPREESGEQHSPLLPVARAQFTAVPDAIAHG